MPSSQTQTVCDPPANLNVASGSGVINRKNVIDQNLKMVGVLKETQPTFFVLEFIDSNLFWDESDTFARKGQPIRVYRHEGDQEFKVGDKLIIEISERVFDPTQHYRVEACGWSARYFEASSIQRYHGGDISDPITLDDMLVLSPIFVGIAIGIGTLILVQKFRAALKNKK